MTARTESTRRAGIVARAFMDAATWGEGDMRAEWAAHADLRALLAERDAALAECDRLRAALSGAADALCEAGKSFSINNPRAARPNLFELHAEVCRAAQVSK